MQPASGCGAKTRRVRKYRVFVPRRPVTSMPKILNLFLCDPKEGPQVNRNNQIPKKVAGNSTW
jgi:hypothetical protein